jgi:hypothetical protein
MDATVAAATVSDQEPVEGVAGAFEPIDLPSSKSDWAVKVRELTKRKDTSSWDIAQSIMILIAAWCFMSYFIRFFVV